MRFLSSFSYEKLIREVEKEQQRYGYGQLEQASFKLCFEKKILNSIIYSGCFLEIVLKNADSSELTSDEIEKAGKSVEERHKKIPIDCMKTGLPFSTLKIEKNINGSSSGLREFFVRLVKTLRVEGITQCIIKYTKSALN